MLSFCSWFTGTNRRKGREEREDEKRKRVERNSFIWRKARLACRTRKYIIHLCLRAGLNRSIVNPFSSSHCLLFRATGELRPSNAATRELTRPSTLASGPSNGLLPRVSIRSNTFEYIRIHRRQRGRRGGESLALQRPFADKPFVCLFHPPSPEMSGLLLPVNEFSVTGLFETME